MLRAKTDALCASIQAAVKTVTALSSRLHPLSLDAPSGGEGASQNGIGTGAAGGAKAGTAASTGTGSQAAGGWGLSEKGRV